MPYEADYKFLLWYGWTFGHSHRGQAERIAATLTGHEEGRWYPPWPAASFGRESPIGRTVDRIQIDV